MLGLVGAPGRRCGPSREPTGFFLVVHIAAFSLGAGFAWLACKRWTVFLFAHTIAEVLDLTAFALVFASAVYAALGRPTLGDEPVVTRRLPFLAVTALAGSSRGASADPHDCPGPSRPEHAR